MDIPIRLKFLKKLDLYQELIRQDKKAKKTSKKVWAMEKILLKWTYNNHHHICSPLKKEKLEQILHKADFATSSIKHIEKVMGNLVGRGFAKKFDEKADVGYGIYFSPDGLYMGEVIYEIEENQWGRTKYPLYLTVVWTIIVTSVVLLFWNVVEKIIDLFK
jgi:hypothetical protein